MEYRRRLPHVIPDDRWVFVTWRLHGSLPQGVYPPPHLPSAGHAFAWIDRYLDGSTVGPQFLRDERIASIVRDALRRGADLGRFQMRAFVLMPNHVHALMFPQAPLPPTLKSLKGFTAHQANRILGRTGTPFWERESYDHWIRDEAELNRIVAYIEMNPVKAGLADRPEDYPWSSAFPD
ncbi:MAG: transposase [Acidobacteriia bacterium]|nr:transposase [Terriglobia bacterium]